MTIQAKEPLADLMEARRDQIAGIAQAWLEAGATAVTLDEMTGRLGCWPDQPAPGMAAISAPITSNGQQLGELRVFGLAGPAVQARLQSDARLIAELATLEDELNTMTWELIGNQDQLLALYDLNESMRSRLEIDEVLQSLAEQAARLTRADYASACWQMGQPPIIIHYPAPILFEQGLEKLFEVVRAAGHRLMVQAGEAAELLPPGMSSALVEPIFIKGQIQAALCLFRKDAGFNSPEMKLTRAICDQAGAQLENALLYRESLAQARLQTEMELAKDVQMHLLPQRLPEVSGLDLAAGTLPAQLVGGDFYDVVAPVGEPFVFMVGDVTGKGMPAALLMTMMRTVLRSKCRSVRQLSPADVLGAANDDLYDDFSEVGMFATVFIGQYQPREQMLYYANAGHSPVIYCPAGGPATLLEADGTAIGVLPVSLAENRALDFRPDDVLVVATDGFSEARNQEDEMYGYDRLLQLIESVADQPAGAIAAALFDAVAGFSAGRAQDDDQTLVVVKGTEA